VKTRNLEEIEKEGSSTEEALQKEADNHKQIQSLIHVSTEIATDAPSDAALRGGGTRK
jgi:hypothetical protein